MITQREMTKETGEWLLTRAKFYLSQVDHYDNLSRECPEVGIFAKFREEYLSKATYTLIILAKIHEIDSLWEG